MTIKSKTSHEKTYINYLYLMKSKIIKLLPLNFDKFSLSELNMLPKGCEAINIVKGGYYHNV